MKMLLLACCCAAAFGQSFEVASVKAATPQGPMGMQANQKGGPGTGDPGSFSCLNCPLFWILSEAYGVQPFEYAGPDWVHELRFDFAAKVPPGASREVFQTMLQNLLVDRFKLAVHREKKEMPVYELTVARNGPKFRESVPPVSNDAGTDDPPPSGPLKRDEGGFPILTKSMSMAIVPGHARIRAVNQPMSWFTNILRNQLQGPIVDSTGLKAKYDFEVSWAFEEGGGGGPGVFQAELINAIQAQLGLKIEHKKGQVEVLAIDHLEKSPTGN